MIALYCGNKAVRSALYQALSRLGPVRVDYVNRDAWLEDIKAAPPKLAIVVEDDNSLKKIHDTNIPFLSIYAEGENGGLRTPVRMGALVEKAANMMKRRAEDMPASIALGRWSLEPRECLVRGRKDGQIVRLTEKERDILLFLYGRNEPVERAALLNEVWDYADGVETHTLETHIYRLRQKIESDPGKPVLLVTSGEGYLLKT